MVSRLAPQLTGDGGHGEGGEGGAEVRVEALYGLEHAEQRDLDQVVERLALAGEALGAVQSQPAVVVDELVAQASPVAR